MNMDLALLHEACGYFGSACARTVGDVTYRWYHFDVFGRHYDVRRVIIPADNADHYEVKCGRRWMPAGEVLSHGN